MFNTIKVLKNRKPLCTTGPNNLQSVFDVAETFKILDAKFPEEEGFTIEVWLYPMRFPRHEWRLIMKHIEARNITSITLILFSK